MTQGQRIKARRLELDLNVEDIAARLGKSRATMYRYENDEIKTLPSDMIGPLAEILHTTTEYILLGSEKEKGDNARIAELMSNVMDNKLSQELLTVFFDLDQDAQVLAVNLIKTIKTSKK